MNIQYNNNNRKHPLDEYICEKYSTIAETTRGHILCQWKPIKLYTKAAEKLNTGRFQLLVTLSLQRVDDKEEKIVNKLEQQLIQYKQCAMMNGSMVPISLLEKAITYYTYELYVMFQLPQYQSVKEYYSSSTINLREFQFHMYQAYDIRQTVTSKGNRCTSLVSNNDYSVGLYFDGVCPFPMLQLTPLWIINQVIPCERMEGCCYCSETKVMEECCDINDITAINHYTNGMDITSNVFPFSTEKLPVENVSSNVEKEGNSDNENAQSRMLFQRIVDILERDVINEKMKETLENIRTRCQTYYLKEIPRYYTVKTIGNGAYGQVHQIISGQKNAYALKSSRGESFNNLKKEAMILSLCNHPNIITFIGFKQMITPRISTGQLCLELCSCNLQEYVDKRRKQGKPLNETEIRSIFHQMVSASEYLYKEFGIVHRDIKLENYLIKEENGTIIVKLCDFGFASKCSEKMFEYVGSPTFCAPEILNNTPYSYKVDMFSLGICLFYMLNGRFPFDVKSSTQLISAYNKRSSFEFNCGVGKELKGMCSNCLSYDVDQRMSISELKVKSEHLVLCA